MKLEGILWETKPNRASFDILLGFILFSPTYRFTASSGRLPPQRLNSAPAKNPAPPMHIKK